MKLRARLALVTIGVTVPMVVGLMAIDGWERHRVAAYVLSENAARWANDPGERERCEASPATWGTMGARPRRPGPPPGPPPPGEGHPPPPMARGPMPPTFYAYDAELRPASPRAPALDPALATQLDASGAVVVPASWYDDRVMVLVGGWGTGPCAFILASGRRLPGFLPGSPLWLLPLVAVLVAILVAVEPVIRRIRRLAAEVRSSAAAGFAGAIASEGRDEVGELARAFDAATAEVRAQLTARDQRERALREFLANTTHDVMIPLTVLLSHLTALREQHAGSPVIGSAMNEAHYIGALLHNLAIAAKLDAGEPELVRSAVDLGALVTRVVGRHAPVARQREVALEHAVPEDKLEAEADLTFLEQAVSNLVYNAIRHNHAGGHVAVLLEPRPDRRFRIRVVDDGPGIAPAELARLLRRGERGDDARTRNPEGQGLGLDIADRVARLHGYELVFSRPAEGGLQVDLTGEAR